MIRIFNWILDYSISDQPILQYKSITDAYQISSDRKMYLNNVSDESINRICVKWWLAYE
jgi:hypothetical protein